MTRTRNLTAIALIALVIGTGVAVKAARSPLALTGTQITEAANRACPAGSFAWRWNVPGSACDAGSDAD